MQSNLNAKLNLLKELKWNLRQPNFRGKMSKKLFNAFFIKSNRNVDA